MLPKKNRADKKTVDEVFKVGKFINLQNLSFKFKLNKIPSQKKISFIVPKSVAKNAVKRNLLRRQGYEILEKYFNQFPAGVSGVFIFKNIMTPLDLEKEIKIILNKI